MILSITIKNAKLSIMTFGTPLKIVANKLIMLSVIMLSIAMLNVVILSVVAPYAILQTAANCKLQISACLQQKCIFSKVKELRLFSQHFIFFVIYEWAQ
jgi:hypothetical protein